MNGYFNRRDAAEYVGCSLRKFETKIKPYLPVYKFGGTPQFRKEDIDAWAESQKVVTASSVVAASTALRSSRRTVSVSKSASALAILRKLEG